MKNNFKLNKIKRFWLDTKEYSLVLQFFDLKTVEINQVI